MNVLCVCYVYAHVLTNNFLLTKLKTDRKRNDYNRAYNNCITLNAKGTRHTIYIWYYYHPKENTYTCQESRDTHRNTGIIQSAWLHSAPWDRIIINYAMRCMRVLAMLVNHELERRAARYTPRAHTLVSRNPISVPQTPHTMYDVHQNKRSIKTHHQTQKNLRKK